jgi:hypothetical protein
MNRFNSLLVSDFHVNYDHQIFWVTVYQKYGEGMIGVCQIVQNATLSWIRFNVIEWIERLVTRAEEPSTVLGCFQRKEKRARNALGPASSGENHSEIQKPQGKLQRPTSFFNPCLLNEAITWSTGNHIRLDLINHTGDTGLPLVYWYIYPPVRLKLVSVETSGPNGKGLQKAQDSWFLWQ